MKGHLRLWRITCNFAFLMPLIHSMSPTHTQAMLEQGHNVSLRPDVVNVNREVAKLKSELKATHEHLVELEAAADEEKATARGLRVELRHCHARMVGFQLEFGLGLAHILISGSRCTSEIGARRTAPTAAGSQRREHRVTRGSIPQIASKIRRPASPTGEYFYSVSLHPGPKRIAG